MPIDDSCHRLMKKLCYKMAFFLKILKKYLFQGILDI
jgi:hypothetical protein